MAVDKNLFLHDLAVAVTIYNEAPYIKEWLDYHILAGVEHFYIYDHESTDNTKEILQPYIERGVVTYQVYPAKLNMMTVYNEAIREYRFFCRYIAFIDADEFILPKSNKSIVEVVDEILADRTDAGGLGINWQIFGSNFQDKADYSKGVLERFTRRAQSNWHNFGEGEDKRLNWGNLHVKTIVNPRRVNFWDNPHYPEYFQGFLSSNENGDLIHDYNNPVTVEKIAVNHYAIKSYEEVRKRRPNLAHLNLEGLKPIIYDDYYNEVFDDTILKYREARREFEGAVKPVDYKKITAALTQNLAPTLNPNLPAKFFEGKMTTFLTCRALCSHLKKFLTDKDSGKILEETALNAIQKTLHTNLLITDTSLLVAELPKILALDYSVVKVIRKDCMQVISQMKKLWANQLKSWGQPDKNRIWKNWAELDYILEMLKLFERN